MGRLSWALVGVVGACSFEPARVIFDGVPPGDGPVQGDGGGDLADGAGGGDDGVPSGTDAGTTGPCVVDIATGADHTCVLRRDGTATCWGNDADGNLGNGPAAVGDVILSEAATQIASSKFHTCARTASGGVVCWGLNDGGQLGDGTKTLRSAPVAVPDLGGVKEVSCGRDQTCALLSDGTARCWGANAYGQLGDDTVEEHLVPAPVTGLTSLVEISAGSRHGCALTSAGTVWCWGHNVNGQLGNGTTAGSLVPIEASISGVQRVSAGGWYAGPNEGYHTCARIGSALRCWGSNADGQLGDGLGGGTSQSSLPVTVSTIDDASEVAAGRRHGCAIRGGGQAWCWGDNASNQLGTTTTADSLVPVAIAGTSGLSLLRAGGEHTCAREGSDVVVCWGANAFGQLGAAGTGGPGPVRTTITCP